MKKIKLTKGKEALVDNENYEYLNSFNWCTNDRYAIRSGPRINGKQTMIYMHKFILNTKDEVDHINGNKLDNRKENLRVVTKSQNQWNRVKRKSLTSQYKGVYWHKHNAKWSANIVFKNKRITLGYYTNEIDAAKAYNTAAIKYFKEYANLNNV